MTMKLALKIGCLALPLALASGCSDDGVQQDEDTAASTTGEQSSAGDGAAAETSPGGSGDGGDSSGQSTAGDPTTSGGSTSGPPQGSGTDGSGSGTDGTGSGTDSGSDSGSDGGTTGAVCEPPDDGAAIGQDCGGGGLCPMGYTCQPFVGFVFQESCQILCTEQCECPMGTACVQVVDKTGIPWMQCSP